MTVLLIVVIVVVVVVILALATTNPMMRKREDAAIKTVKDKLGADRITLIEPRTTAMGTDPEEAGGVRGMACLALNADELLAVTWVGGNEFSLPRASITGVDTAADDPEAVPKATVTVTFTRGDGTEATAMFRLREPAEWLTELGYDWGESGPPVKDEDEAEGPDETDETDAEGDPGAG